MKKVVIIGGGHGVSLIVRALKTLANIQLSAIVTVADDGGSTGRLRQLYAIPAMGDIRNVMCAMSERENLLTKLMNYRFEGKEFDVGGHNLGNLILTALTHECGNFLEAIHLFSKVMNITGEIIPSSSEVITLYAKMEDGTIVKGESNIPHFNNRIQKVFYDRKVEANQQALDRIREADFILYGIGSLYTSIMPNLIITDIQEELKKSKAKKIFLCNAMTQPGETDGYSLEDHVQAIYDHTGPYAIDLCITHNNRIRNSILENYAAMGSSEVCMKDQCHKYRVIKKDILTFEKQLIRHDVEKIRFILKRIIDGKVI